MGFKIHTGNNEIEAKPYNYSKNKYKKRLEPTFMRTIKGELIELTPVQHPIMKLKKRSKNENFKFMPFVPLGVFRVLDKKDNIRINNHEYKCIQIEGFDTLIIGDQWKYWMAVNKPGLIVKVIHETSDTRFTWLLKEIK